MTWPKCFPNKRQRGQGVCPGLSLRPGSMYTGERYCETHHPCDAGSTTPEQTQFPGEKRGVSVPAARAAGRCLERPQVFTCPGRQQAVITALWGWQGVYTWYTPGTCGLFWKSTQTGMGGEEHRGQGAPVMAEALPNGKGYTGKRKRPRSIAEGPKHGRCRDEVKRCGSM